MRALKVALPAVFLLTGLVVCTSISYATQEFAKKEKKSCTFCHGKVEAKENMPKNLTEAGKYYKAHDHKLDGYTEKK
jgi:hypothetical protein